MTRRIEAALSRSERITAVALALVAVLAWAWLATGAGMNPSAAGPMAMPTDAPSPPAFAMLLSMWWAMMVAMMVPSAAPTVLLFARASRHVERPPAVASFVAGYLAVWGIFSVVAAGAQQGLQSVLLLSPMAMTSTSHVFSGAVMLAAAAYQFSPLKAACLGECRHPALFLARHFRPGARGAFAMGVRHGGFCVGCCWALMALLFIGGVMNPLWIAGLALLVAAEKLLPVGRWIARISGGVMGVAGVLLLAGLSPR